jgi:thiol-disulfide isomerase/thioredoxin
MNKGVIAGVVAIVAIAAYAGMMARGQSAGDTMMNKDTMDTKEVTMEKEGMMVKDESAAMEKDMMDKGDETMMKKEDSGALMDKKESGAMMKGSYEVYAPEKIARAEHGDVVLFFHASWCPSCRSLDSNIEANKSSIPAGLSILKVDYDKETELKKKYGVTYQFTMVQVGADGSLIKKWSGSPTLADLASQVQ